MAIKLEGQVTRIWQMRNAYKFLIGNSEGKDYLGELGEGEKILVKVDL
jgi:hypothetical protein